MLDDEQSLVIRSRDRGERAAFEDLVRRTARWLFARIYLETGGDVHRTDDLLQETFLRPGGRSKPCPTQRRSARGSRPLHTQS